MPTHQRPFDVTPVKLNPSASRDSAARRRPCEHQERVPAISDSTAYGTEGMPTRTHVWLMLQSLLEDRFHLQVHRETKDLPVYALTAAKGGIKLPRPRETILDPTPHPLRPKEVSGLPASAAISMSPPRAGDNRGRPQNALIHPRGAQW